SASCGRVTTQRGLASRTPVGAWMEMPWAQPAIATRTHARISLQRTTHPVLLPISTAECRMRQWPPMMRYLFTYAIAATGCAHFYKLEVKDVTALEVSGDAQSQTCARGGLVDVRAVTKDGQKHAEGEHEHPKENEFDPALVKLEASAGGFHDRSWNPPDD